MEAVETTLTVALLNELRVMVAGFSRTKFVCGLVADAMMVEVSSGVPSTPVQCIG